MNKQHFRKLIKEVYQEVLEEEKIKEGILSWMGGVARNIAYGIIDKRAGYLQKAIQYDPKLQRLAKDLKLNSKDLESRVASLLDKDPDFLRALSNVKAKRI